MIIRIQFLMRGGIQMPKWLKRALIILALAAAAWYTAVFTLIPRLAHCPRSPLPEHAQASLHAHMFSVCSDADEFGNVAGSVLLQKIVHTKIRGNRYYLKVLPEASTEPAAVVAYPKRYQWYSQGCMHRVLHVCFDKSWFPTYLLTRDGDLYVNRESQFSARNVPPDDVLSRVRESEEWRYHRSLSIEPPCSITGTSPSEP